MPSKGLRNGVYCPCKKSNRDSSCDTHTERIHPKSTKLARDVSSIPNWHLLKYHWEISRKNLIQHPIYMNQLCYVYIVILCLISLKTIELSFYFSNSDVEGGLQKKGYCPSHWGG